jgi:hypothetical protein
MWTTRINASAESAAASQPQHVAVDIIIPGVEEKEYDAEAWKRTIGKV